MQIDFPSKEHVRAVCKIESGAETCKYLAVSAQGLQCAKGTSVGAYIDSKADMRAKGDNCLGILPYLCDGRLEGKRVHHKESMPYFEVSGTVEVLEVHGGMLVLVIDGDDGQKYGPWSIALGYLDITSNNGKGVVIAATFPGGNTWTFSEP